MPNKQIYELTAVATPVPGTAMLPIQVAAGVTNKITLQQLRQVYNVTDYGAVGNGVANDTTAIQAAITATPTGATLYFPPGTYRVTQNELSFGSKSLSLVGENAAINIVSGGTGSAVFNFAGSSSVLVEGFTFTTSLAFSQLFKDITSNYIASFIVRSNTFQGPVSLFRNTGSTSLNPAVATFGLGYFEYSNNTVKDMTVSHIVLGDTPITKGLITKNYVNNFGFTFFNDSVTNGAPYEFNFYDQGNISITNNTVICDDSFYCPAGGGVYYTFALVENNTVDFSYNHVEGMKESSSVTRGVYDAYLSSVNVTSSNNVYKNNVNFNTAAENVWVIKCKLDSTVARPCTKTIANNTYVIEDDWVKRLGKTASQVRHKLYNTGVTNSGDLTITNCVFDMQTLSNPLNHSVENGTFTNNVIKAKELADSGFIIEFSPVDSSSVLSVENNVVSVTSSSLEVRFLNAQSGGAISLREWKYLSVQNNTFNADTLANVSNIFIGYTKAAKFLCNNNTVNMPLLYAGFENYIKNGIVANNVFNGVRTGGSRNAYFSYVYGNSIYSNTFNGRPELVYISLLQSTTFIPAATTNYLVTVKFNTSSGWNEIEFKYTLQYAAGVYTLVWTDSGGTPRSDILGTSAGNNVVIQATTTGTGALTLTARLLNPSGHFQLLGIPTGTTSYVVDIQSFE